MGFACTLQQVARCKTQTPAHTVILGDFNAEPHEGVTACAEAFTEVPLFEATEAITTTFHNYGRWKPNVKIDYIFLSEELKDRVKTVTVWDEEQNGIYLSDHYPVCAELAL